MPSPNPGSDRPQVTKRRAETRNRLLSAASEVFAERGFGRATVEDVCERAGYTRGAFYSNFGSLDELFFALYAARSAEVARAVGEAVREAVESAPGEADLSLEDVMDRVVAALPISRESHLLNLEFGAHALRHPEVASALAEHRRELRQALTPILRLGLLAAGAPEFTGRTLDDIGRTVIAVQDGMYLQELLEPDDSRLPSLRRKALTDIVNNARP